MNDAWKAVQGVVMGSMQCTPAPEDLAVIGRFLDRVGYVPREDESKTEAFSRLHRESPELFPVPRENESLWDAIREVAGRV